MQFFKPGSLKIDFIGKRKPFIMLSIALVFIAMVVVVWRQAGETMNWGIDFAGGTVIDLEFEKEVDIGAVRKTVTDLGYKKNVIQRSGLASKEGKSEYIIRVERIAILDGEDARKLEEGLKGAFGEKLVRFDFDEDGGDQFEIRFNTDPGIESVTLFG